MHRGMSNLDALERRNRYSSQSSGKRVSLKSRDLRWLEALRDHGPLPSHYLDAFSSGSHTSPKSSRQRLTDLAHETNTPHGGAYLRRPDAQRAAVNALNQPLVYDLTDAGWEALGDRSGYETRPTGPFAHQLMVASVSASIELGCASLPGVRFIPGRSILSRANASLAIDLEMIIPPDRLRRVGRLIPDQLFALEYSVGREKRYLSFVLECDRGTEPITSTDAARKSFLRNYLQYRQFVGSGLYRKHYGLNSSLLVLNVMNSATRMKAYMAMIAKLSPDGNSFMLFRHIEHFGSFVTIPPLMPELTMQPWHRPASTSITLSVP